MPSVTIHDTTAPAAAEQPAAPPKVTTGPDGVQKVVDETGRTITLRRELALLEETDLYAAIGPEQIENKGVLLIAINVARVAAIDGDPLPVPRNSLQLRAAIQRVGRAGVKAVQEAFAAEDAATPDATAAAKN